MCMYMNIPIFKLTKTCYLSTADGGTQETDSARKTQYFNIINIVLG